MALTLPQGMRIRLSFVSGMVLDALPGWAETLFALPPPQRLAALADADVRRRLDAGAQSPDAGIIGLLANWSRLRIVETFSDATAAYEGRRVGDIAAERGVDPFDALCDIVVADELRTGISPEMPPEPPEVWQARLAAWRDPRTLVGGSDAGAHLDMMCGAAYSTFLLGPAVRDLELLAIEEAVHLLTGAPADFYGLADRGRLVPGAAADLAVVDPATVGPGAERTVADLPGGASRIVADTHGVGDVVVAGTAIVRHGTFTGATPGRVLRSGDRHRNRRARPDGPGRRPADPRSSDLRTRTSDPEPSIPNPSHQERLTHGSIRSRLSGATSRQPLPAGGGGGSAAVLRTPAAGVPDRQHGRPRRGHPHHQPVRGRQVRPQASGDLQLRPGGGGHRPGPSADPAPGGPARARQVPPGHGPPARAVGHRAPRGRDAQARQRADRRVRRPGRRRLPR
ncbi:MAG: amidohydrolase family protein [Acidimicrobiales bacterium]